MTSAVTDIQYAMTFDLASGRRLTLSDFIGKENLAKARALVEAFDSDAALEEDNFYVDDKGQLFLFAERTQPQPGREAPESFPPCRAGLLTAVWPLFESAQNIIKEVHDEQES